MWNTKKFIDSKKGQVLVIVLIIMVVLAITILTITNNTIRDIEQSDANIKYENLYAEAEKITIDLGQGLDYTDDELEVQEIKSRLDSLLGISSTCEEEKENEKHLITCSGTSTDTEDNTFSITARVTDSNQIETVRLLKDDTIIYKIDPTQPFNSSNIFTITMSGESMDNPEIEAGIEVAFDFKFVDKTGQIQYTTVKGIFDRTGNLFQNQENHYFDFMPIGTSPHNVFSFSYNTLIENILAENEEIASQLNPNPQIEPVAFRFRLIYPTETKESIPSIFISVQTSNPQSVIQSRTIDSTVVELRDIDEKPFGPQPFVTSSIPTHRTPSILDYVLRSQTDIEHAY